jgi:hypothetical protein
MSFKAVPESTSYRDPVSGEFFQRQGTVSGSGRYEPIQTMEIRYDRDKPSRAVTLPYIPGQDKSEVVPMRNNAVNKSQKWKEFSVASQDYSQSGTDIPDFNAGFGGAFAAGSDFPGQGFGYQYQSPATIAGSPSFDMNKPYIPGQQDYTGIPNATPEMLRRLQQRKMVNPGGQQLPGFLKPV